MPSEPCDTQHTWSLGECCLNMRSTWLLMWHGMLAELYDMGQHQGSLIEVSHKVNTCTLHVCVFFWLQLSNGDVTGTIIWPSPILSKWPNKTMLMTDHQSDHIAMCFVCSSYLLSLVRDLLGGSPFFILQQLVQIDYPQFSHSSLNKRHRIPPDDAVIWLKKGSCLGQHSGSHSGGH